MDAETRLFSGELPLLDMLVNAVDSVQNIPTGTLQCIHLSKYRFSSLLAPKQRNRSKGSMSDMFNAVTGSGHTKAVGPAHIEEARLLSKV